MRRELSALVSGILFGIGLLVSGMTKPSKVIGFLDFAGQWDASLAFVMLGGIGTHVVFYRLITRRQRPLFETKFHIPKSKDIDKHLVAGAALFGIGWGLAGYCPGPGLASLLSGPSALTFVFAMVVGMYLHNLRPIRSLLATAASPSARIQTPPLEASNTPVFTSKSSMPCAEDEMMG